MVALTEQIQQDLKHLEQRVTQVAIELQGLYADYLQCLGSSVQQQLILASYHLCTQTHPEIFLTLSLTQRQTLQQSLQKLAYALLQCLLGAATPLVALETDTGLKPETVMKVCEEIEDAIVGHLRQAAMAANRLLQEHGMIKISSLEKLFAIAVKEEELGRPITSEAHLLKALVDSPDDDDEQVAPVVALYLQLSEIEFTDSTVMKWRNQLRQAFQQLLSLQKEYFQKQEELTRAEATSAWRASWFPYLPETPA
ncbi:hypothetical protein GS597_06855 [Synechococcales cyanobacterium C]|uniref:Uncharacterized protein n=1 Tax=Petrachloros mirabilis ULC683 TaxID=2781853 RepID=A0A8K1ZW56_9CYAN|nr:hypothetical protein [Petrachloros mirabilis]NCJ06239.1 hypothetical protein [Petrachloros mirabilis ULC683]